LIKKINDWQALDNTLVIFMTDNGMGMRSIKKDGKRIMAYNAGMKGTKNSAWEGGTHVPAFWYWKGVLGEGLDIDALTAHVDLYRTFSDLAGAKIPESKLTPGGRSLLPLLSTQKTAQKAQWPDRKLFVHKGRWDDDRWNKKTREENKYNGAAVRTEQWRLVYSSNKGKVITELSDITKDPGETTNLAEQFPDVVAQLGKAYDKWWDSTEALLVNEKLPFVTPEQQPLTLRYQKQLKEKGIPDWAPGDE
jgi:arylsulfatase A-like enzyme